MTLLTLIHRGGFLWLQLYGHRDGIPKETVSQADACLYGQ